MYVCVFAEMFADRFLLVERERAVVKRVIYCCFEKNRDLLVFLTEKVSEEG